MSMIYRTSVDPGEATGGVPKRILDIWCQDVGENQAAAIKTTCTADNFTFHRRHLDFIKRWVRAIEQNHPC